MSETMEGRKWIVSIILLLFSLSAIQLKGLLKYNVTENKNLKCAAFVIGKQCAALKLNF